MTQFIDFNIETDPDDLVALALDYLQGEIPGWEPSPAHFEYILMQSLARMVAEARDIASLVPKEVFKYFGSTLLHLPPLEAARATALTTWTMVDDAGYMVPAGTIVSIAPSGSESYLFETLADFTVVPGDTDLSNVTVAALDAGSEPSGITGPVTLVDSLAFVSSVTISGSTSGGVDAEDEDEYLNRLSQELQLLSPQPILPNDFAILAKRVQGVSRSVALDGYNPADDTYDNERMVTVAVVDDDGLALGSPVKAEVEALLESQREINFVVNVVDPDYTTVNVSFNAKAYPGFILADVEARAEAAVTAYLSPANWGIPPVGDSRDWINEVKVRYLEVATVINNVDGIDYITALTVNSGTTDVTLNGVITMPTPGTIAGTVS